MMKKRISSANKSELLPDGRGVKKLERLRVVIVGVGPAGGVLAAFLIRGGHEVILVDRSRSLSLGLWEHGLTVSGVVDVALPPQRLYANVLDVAGCAPDLVVVATKAPMVPLLCPDLRRVAEDDTVFLSYQNGIDTEVPLVEAFGAERVARAVVRYGANLIECGHFRMTFWHRPNYLGSLAPELGPFSQKLAESLTDAGLPTAAVADIRSRVWEKSIANALNSVCGLTGLSIGGVLDIPSLREAFVALLDERIAVATAAGFALRPSLREDLIEFHERARSHVPSSYEEIQTGLPSEVDYLEGKFVEYARRLGVPAPINQAILGLVHGRIAGERNRAIARVRAPLADPLLAVLGTS